ncbi:uncharacterized protein LOC129587244 [Paramacrobiotus metropolitanus]|uniref:uncharacterized protein LOC129587244 n=1 Tax=Paramacrobiotus metropolitanus TaxID=2943436 RepID=UPI002445B55A|nr:uncharacterized protein LOC129587244 [Paramacrobiotus metropolitanus]
MRGIFGWKTKQLQNFVQRLKKLSAHYSLFLLKNCLSIPKVLYGLRTSRSYEHPQLLKEYDQMLRLGVEQLVNVNISEAQWTQISLPVWRGGLGTRRIETLAVCAYLASVYSVQPIVSEFYQPTEECLTKTAQETWVQLTEGEIPAEFLRKFQFAWDNPVIDRDISLLMSSTEGSDRARAVLLAALNKDSGAWLNALPAPCLGTFLRDDDVRTGVGLRFGLPVVVAHHCIAYGTQVETNGHHGLSCNKSTKGRWARHKEMNSIAKNCCKSAGYPCQLEPTGLSSTDGKRPDGMTLIPVRQGRPLVWDVTSWCTVADFHVAASAKKSGILSQMAENSKRRTYSFLEYGYLFYPLVIETLGVFGPAFSEMLHFMGRKIRDITGEARSTAFLKQRFSLAVVKGNATAVLSALPFNPREDKDFGWIGWRPPLYRTVMVCPTDAATAATDAVTSQCDVDIWLVPVIRLEAVTVLAQFVVILVHTVKQHQQLARLLHLLLLLSVEMDVMLAAADV